jgi:hypothetical protein
MALGAAVSKLPSAQPHVQATQFRVVTSEQITPRTPFERTLAI